MDLIFIGIIDIIIIIFSIVSIYFGYEKGLMKKSISLMTGIVIIGISFLFCKDLSNFLINNKIIHPQIYSNIEKNIIEGIYEYMGTDVSIAELSVSEIVNEVLGLPGFLADMIVEGVGNPSASEMVSSITVYISDLLMKVVSFFIILLSLFVLCIILRLLVNILRSSSLIRFVDGVLGALLYLSFMLIIIYVLFAILNPLVENGLLGGFKKFIEVDLQLNSDEFRISKLFYENNIFVNVFKIIF